MRPRSFIALFVAIAAAFAVLAFLTSYFNGGQGAGPGIWAFAALVSLSSLVLLSSGKPGRACERRER